MEKLDWEIQQSKDTLVKMCKYKFADDESWRSQLRQVLRTLLILENELENKWFTCEYKGILIPHKTYLVYTNTKEVLMDVWTGKGWRHYNGITHFKNIDLTTPNR